MSTIDTLQQNVYEQQIQQQQVEIDTAVQAAAAEVNEEYNSQEATESEKKNNNSVFLEGKRDDGYQLTHINDGETNFFQYGDALSDEVKDMILDSYDCQQDYVLQSEIAQLFKDNHVYQTNDFVGILRSMGYDVNVSRVSTQYVSDWKKSKYYDFRENGSINMLTISDGKGGEIKIVDANGNAAIECEELFMNEILEGLANDEFFAGDIGEIKGGTDHGHAHYSSGQLGNHSDLDIETIKDIEKKSKISATEYDKLVDSYVYNYGYTVETAIKLVNAKYDLSENTMTYSGRYQDLQNQDNTSDALANNTENKSAVDSSDKETDEVRKMLEELYENEA